jgi:MFS family permease
LVSAAQFVLQLDFSIVNVALPTIQRELGFSPADLQWIVTGYALTFGSLLLLGGRLGDVVGRRRLLMTGLILFGVTSLSAGLAQTSLALVISRFAQGASAAVVAPTALAPVTDLYAEGPGRARALGIFQGATAAGASAGIVFGGILTQYVGWRSVFLVNPPIIAVLVVAIARVLPRQGTPLASPAWTSVAPCWRRPLRRAPFTVSARASSRGSPHR